MEEVQALNEVLVYISVMFLVKTIALGNQQTSLHANVVHTVFLFSDTIALLYYYSSYFYFLKFRDSLTVLEED